MNVEVVGGRTVMCAACGEKHHERYLCDAAKEIVEKHLARTSTLGAMVFDLGEMVPAETLGIGAGENDRILTALSIHAGVFQKPRRPALAITGEDYLRRPVPHWLFSGSPDNLRALGAHVPVMIDHAIKLAEG